MRARKRFGQHFLETAWAAKVARCVAPGQEDTFIEIGPGRGALTRPLSSAARRVIAYEIDRDLAAELRTSALPNVTVVEGDFLAATPEQLAREVAVAPPASIRAAGNLPYNVASPIMFKLVELYEAGLPLIDATVMLQREVADRLVARPGSREYGVLSVLIRLRADVQRLLTLPPGAFRPPPKVQSAVVRLQFHPPAPRPRHLLAFAAMTQAVFTRRRKTLANALLAYPPAAAVGPAKALAAAGIDGRRRPETLDIAELVRLSDAVEGAVL